MQAQVCVWTDVARTRACCAACSPALSTMRRVSREGFRSAKMKQLVCEPQSEFAGCRAAEAGAVGGRAACSASQAVEAAAAAVVKRFGLNADQAAVVRSTVPWFAPGVPAQVRLVQTLALRCMPCRSHVLPYIFMSSTGVEDKAP